jgi:hypothetical protein
LVDQLADAIFANNTTIERDPVRSALPEIEGAPPLKHWQLEVEGFPIRIDD